MKEQSFIKLFRQSQFARWETARQPVKPSKYPLSFSGPNIDESLRPSTHYGLKHDPPPRLWGRPVNVVRVKELDGEYDGLGIVEHANIDTLRIKLLGTLERARVEAEKTSPSDLFGLPVANDPNDGSTQERAKYYSRDPIVKLGKRIPVVGRLLRRIDTGYTVNVVGLHAHLPLFEIPKYCEFSMEDLVRKRAFKFYVKEVHFEPSLESPKMILTFFEC